MGICKTGQRCRRKAGQGRYTCGIKDHVCEENSVSKELYLRTELPRDLVNIISEFVHDPTTAYVIGANTKDTDRPFSVYFITNDKFPVFAGGQEEDRWEGSDATSCVVNGLIYVFGGKNDQETGEVSSRKVAIYDPRNDTWDTTTVPMIPGRFVTCSPVVIGSTIYVVSTFRKDEPVQMYSLDTTSLQWSDAYSGRTPNILHSTICSIDKIIYAVGNRMILSSGEMTTTLYTFDTEVKKEWEASPINVPALIRYTVVIKNKMYLFGAFSDFYVIDVKTKNCTKLSGIDFSSSYPFLLEDERYIYVVTAAGRTTEIVTYDIEKDRWLVDETVLIPLNNFKKRRYRFSVVTLPGSSI